MTNEFSNWTVKDWLESAAYAAAILGAIAGAIFYVSSARSESIANTSKVLVNHWTNEGDISSDETRFITLSLQNVDGDIIGQLESPSFKNPIEVHAKVGWRHTKLTLTQLGARDLKYIATVQVKIADNNNRLEWNVVSRNAPTFLPKSSVLWPLPKNARPAE